MSNTITRIWRRPYTLRRYKPQIIKNGYATSAHEDITVNLDVQFLSQRELQLLPEGKRSTAHIKSYGDFVVRTADADTGTPADKLYYQGSWWECESSVVRDKTILAHCLAQYVRVSEANNEAPPTKQEENEDDV